LTGQPQLAIRPYRPEDHEDVRRLFIDVNRDLAPAHLRQAFETYIDRSLAEEIDHIDSYYMRPDGSNFWVARLGPLLAGMAGMERIDHDTVEVRRMYVNPGLRRQGVARRLLAHLEQWAASSGYGRIILSTSELQAAALAFYKANGYRLLEQRAAESQSNKTIGGGVVRSYFEKALI
jgi:putative acetyltransferase